MTTMKWTGLFPTFFIHVYIFYQELRAVLYYGNTPLFLRHIPVAMATEV